MPAYAILLFLCFIARRKRRDIKATPLNVLAPVDGVITEVKTAQQHPYLDGPAKRIRIRQSAWGEFVLHSPIEGKVIERWWPDKSDSGAKNFGFVVQADEGDRCVIDIVNAMRPRFKTHFVPSGYRTRQGQRCGLIGMGVLVDVYVAEASLAKVEVGDKVKAGCDRVGRFRRHR